MCNFTGTQAIVTGTRMCVVSTGMPILLGALPFPGGAVPPPLGALDQAMTTVLNVVSGVLFVGGSYVLLGSIYASLTPRVIFARPNLATFAFWGSACYQVVRPYQLMTLPSSIGLIVPLIILSLRKAIDTVFLKFYMVQYLMDAWCTWVDFCEQQVVYEEIRV